MIIIRGDHINRYVSSYFEAYTDYEADKELLSSIEDPELKFHVGMLFTKTHIMSVLESFESISNLDMETVRDLLFKDNVISVLNVLKEHIRGQLGEQTELDLMLNTAAAVCEYAFRGC